MSNYETLMLTLQQDALYMTTWIAVCVPVLLLAVGACVLMWLFSQHKSNPDQKYSELIVNVIFALYCIGSFIIVAIVLIAPFPLKGRIAFLFLSIWIPAVTIIGMIILCWFEYQRKGKRIDG